MRIRNYRLREILFPEIPLPYHASDILNSLSKGMTTTNDKIPHRMSQKRILRAAKKKKCRLKVEEGFL